MQPIKRYLSIKSLENYAENSKQKLRVERLEGGSAYSILFHKMYR